MVTTHTTHHDDRFKAIDKLGAAITDIMHQLLHVGVLSTQHISPNGGCCMDARCRELCDMTYIRGCLVVFNLIDQSRLFNLIDQDHGMHLPLVPSLAKHHRNH